MSPKRSRCWTGPLENHVDESKEELLLDRTAEKSRRGVQIQPAPKYKCVALFPRQPQNITSFVFLFKKVVSLVDRSHIIYVLKVLYQKFKKTEES